MRESGPAFRFDVDSAINGKHNQAEMRETTDLQLDRYLTHLRELPFVKGARILTPEPKAGVQRADAVLVLKAPNGEHELLVETKRTNLTQATADHFLAVHPRSRKAQHHDQDQWILLAPYVPRTIGRHLAVNGVNYMDLEGNCHLQLDDQYIAAMEGRVPMRKEPEGRGLRAAGYQVLFAILADPRLVNEGIVKVAKLADVGKTTVADTFHRLQRDGSLANVGRQRRLVKPRAVLDQWLVGYANAVRPRLLVGRYRAQVDDPGALERQIEDTIGADTDWAWGGGAAALRLTRHYRGETTVLHVARARPDLAKRLRLLRDPNGTLLLLEVPGPIAFAGAVPHTVHPLLVYTELLTSGYERAREAAIEIREQYLSHLT